MAYRRFNLNESANEYIFEQLHWGGSVARALLGRITPSEGRVHTYLPHNYDDKALYEFDRLQIVSSENVDRFLMSAIRSHLSLDSTKVAVAENAGFNRGDPVVEKFTSRMCFEGDNIYHLLLPTDSDEMIVRDLNESGGNWLDLIFLSSLPTGLSLEPQAEIGSVVFSHLARSTLTIICRAYDADSYLFWELGDEAG
ncbi:MAG: hypothetical protein RBT76_07025 [candidate division Zixibacteria bacterium]|jgi:hypothetical protein|nr:hypothetical protein [candidate division Zixibacteria bacterium]